MDYQDILQELGSCGLNCRKCFAYSKGDIKRTSGELQKRLGDFDRYAERFAGFLPVFKNYPAFKELLVHMAQADCDGCRQGQCKFPNCGVAPCAREKGVDFCFQCLDFPCDRSNFDADLKRRWIQMNNRMKEIGVKAYFEETKDIPRYR
jgi:hypothetical protein